MGTHIAPAGNPPIPVGERPHRRFAAHLTTLADPPQAEPRLVNGLAGDGGGGLQGGADLLEVEATELAHQKSAALSLGKILEVDEQPAQTLAVLCGLRWL